MKCEQHPERDATGLCVYCGRGVCPICNIKYEGKTHCKVCIENGRLVADPMRFQLVPASPYISWLQWELLQVGFFLLLARVQGHDMIMAVKGDKDDPTGWHNDIVFMRQLEQITIPTVDQFSQDAYYYALAAIDMIEMPDKIEGLLGKGKIHCYLILSSANVQPTLREWIEATHPRRHRDQGDWEIPIVHDSNTDELFFYNQGYSSSVDDFIKNYIITAYVRG